MTIVLASASPRRKELLAHLIDDFEVHPSGASEDGPDLGPQDLAMVLARRKALDVGRRRKEDLILGADTLLDHGHPVGKPEDADGARALLADLSGTTHRVLTGVALAWRGRIVDEAVAVSAVHLAPIPRPALDDYINSGAWEGKAGGYGIQDPHLRPWLTLQAGPYSNVVGLPLAVTRDMLMRNDVPCKPLPDEADL